MLFTTIMRLGGLSMDIFRNSLKAELQHLVKINFFAAFSISLLGTLLASLAGLALFYSGVAVFGTLLFLCLAARLKAWLKAQLLKLNSRIPRKFI
ncbi:MAG: hypothetical protein SPI08_02470 [Campylobacter sp.]|nr:hypothetical protein [Campylobacter sp.]